jgi:hypothetical protein
MFEKKSEKLTDWEMFFNDILELIYFMDHLNFHKKMLLLLFLRLKTLA